MLRWLNFWLRLNMIAVRVRCAWPAGAAEQRDLVSRMRAVVEAKDAEIAALRAELDAEREREAAGVEGRGDGAPAGDGQHGLWDAGLEGGDRGEGARQARRQVSERERSKDRKRGGQPGHPGGPAAGSGPG